MCSCDVVNQGEDIAGVAGVGARSQRNPGVPSQAQANPGHPGYLFTACACLLPGVT